MLKCSLLPYSGLRASGQLPVITRPALLRGLQVLGTTYPEAKLLQTLLDIESQDEVAPDSALRAADACAMQTWTMLTIRSQSSSPLQARRGWQVIKHVRRGNTSPGATHLCESQRANRTRKSRGHSMSARPILYRPP